MIYLPLIFFNQFIVSFLFLTLLSEGDKLLIFSHNMHSCNKYIYGEMYQTHNWLQTSYNSNWTGKDIIYTETCITIYVIYNFQDLCISWETIFDK